MEIENEGRPAGANEPRPAATTGEVGWWRWIRTAAQTFLFGFDFFISYRHADGAVCARSLHAQLKRDFDCFLDELHYEAGHNLPLMQSQALKRSRKLLLIVSPLAHLSPSSGNDWLLAEVREFKHLAERRVAAATIVPIGTHRTLSITAFPDSKLFLEIPSLEAGTLAILDEAVELRGEISPTTIEKLRNDFRELRRRQLRRGVSVILALALLAALTFGTISAVHRFEAQRAATLERALRLLGQGAEPIQRKLLSYQEAYGLLTGLGRDPIMAQHGIFSERLHDLRADVIADVEGEVDTITVSDDSNWLLVTYDYQSPAGSPEPEQIPDRTALAVFNIPSRTWTLRQSIGSPIGAELYRGGIDAFQPPHHVILRASSDDGHEAFEKVSLQDGSRAPYEMTPAALPGSTAHAGDSGQVTTASAKVFQLLSTDSLFKIHPDDGIDMEYGPRVVERTDVTAPDGRTRIVGTYEGRLILLDLENGQLRGEIETSPIFAAAYAPHSKRAYVADATQLWEIDTSHWQGVIELPAAVPWAPDGDTVLDVALSDDGSTITLATQHQLMARTVDAGEWLTWPLPAAIEHIAALRVDGDRSRIDLVSGDDGTIMSANLRSVSSPLEVIRRPGALAPSVAWIDAPTDTAWIVGRTWSKGAAQIRAVPLPSSQAKALTLRIAQPPTDNGPFQHGQIHALAKLKDQVVVFHGDESSFEDNGRDLEHEQVLRISLVPGAVPTNHVVFESEEHSNGPDPVSIVTQVRSVLPASTPTRILIATDFQGAFEITENGTPKRQMNSRYLSSRQDGAHSYLIGIGGQETERWIDIRHEATQTSLRYQLPWTFRNGPDFTVIGNSGRLVMLASKQGEIMLFDVDAAAQMWTLAHSPEFRK